MDTTPYEKAAARWRPANIRLLVVAESPPTSLDRYFYYPNVRKHDDLWLGMMKGLYGEDFGKAKSERPRKVGWLERFKDDRCFLIDAVREPFARGTSSGMRERVIRENASRCIAEALKLEPEGVLLIKATVWNGLADTFRSSKLLLLNPDSLSFPGSGHQGEFLEDFAKFRVREFVKSGRQR